MDFGNYVNSAIKAGATELCQEVLLSLGVSYTYLGYLTQSSSQLKDIVLSRIPMANEESINGNAVFIDAVDMEAQGCPRRMFAAYGNLGEPIFPGRLASRRAWEVSTTTEVPCRLAIFGCGWVSSGF